MFTEPSVFLGTAVAAGLVAIAGLVAVGWLGRAGATQLTVRIVAIFWFVLVVVLDILPLIITAALAVAEWGDSFAPATTFWSSRAGPFWEAVTRFLLALVPLVLGIACLGWSWNRRSWHR